MRNRLRAKSLCWFPSRRNNQTLTMQTLLSCKVILNCVGTQGARGTTQPETKGFGEFDGESQIATKSVSTPRE